MTSNSMSPNHREALTARSSITGQDEYLLSTNGALNTTGGGGGGGGGTSSTFGSTFPTTGTAIGAISSTGTMAGLNLDSSGNLKISGSITVGSTTDETAFTAGSSTFQPAGGVFNDSVASLTSGQQGTYRLTATRAQHINLRNNTGTEIGTSTTPLQVSLANTAANSIAVKTDGSATTQPISGTVTANAGTNLNTSALALESGGNLASIKTDVDNLNLAQGSTTSGQKGNLHLGAVTTSAPTYITGQSNPLSLDTSGNLRVAGTFSANPATDPSPTTGTITVQDTASTTTTSGSYQGVGIITGSPTANSFVTRAISGFSSARIMITGTWTGTLSLEKSADGGTTWTTSVWKVQGSVYNTGTTTGNGMFDSTAGAATNIRVRASGVITGTANIVIQPGYGIESVNIVNPIRIYDNTSGSSVTVKTASTTAIATDTSLVVGLSPNSPLPTGANVIGHVITDSGSTTVVTSLPSIPAGANTIGAISNTSFIATQATAANLNATVVGTGTFATQLTGSTNNINNISGTISLPTGAATAANQSTEITSLSTIASATHAEDAAAASGDQGVQVLAIRNDTLTASQTNANGDYGAVSIDTSGIMIVAGAPRALKGVPTDTTISSSTTETTVLTAVASTFLDVYGATFTNSSATATKVTLRDATAGTVRWVGYIPAGDMRGFMLPVDSAVPQNAVNNNWTVTCGTSVASIDVTLFYVKRV